MSGEASNQATDFLDLGFHATFTHFSYLLACTDTPSVSHLTTDYTACQPNLFRDPLQRNLIHF